MKFCVLKSEVLTTQVLVGSLRKELSLRFTGERTEIDVPQPYFVEVAVVFGSDRTLCLLLGAEPVTNVQCHHSHSLENKQSSRVLTNLVLKLRIQDSVNNAKVLPRPVSVLVMFACISEKSFP